MIKRLWCFVLHRGYWLSFDFGTWWTTREIHGGRFDVKCCKCGCRFVGQHYEDDRPTQVFYNLAGLEE